MATTIVPYVPAPPASTTSTSSTTTTTLCVSTVVANVMTLSAYKRIGLGLPGFTFTSSNPKAQVSGYRIKTLPVAGDGILYLNNVAVTANQLISRADNGKLVYVPKTDADAQASFTFSVETSCGNSADQTVTINVSAAPLPSDCNCNSTTTSSTSTTTV